MLESWVLSFFGIDDGQLLDGILGAGNEITTLLAGRFAEESVGSLKSTVIQQQLFIYNILN